MLTHAPHPLCHSDRVKRVEESHKAKHCSTIWFTFLIIGFFDYAQDDTPFLPMQNIVQNKKILYKTNFVQYYFLLTLLLLLISNLCNIPFAFNSASLSSLVGEYAIIINRLETIMQIINFIDNVIILFIVIKFIME